MGLECFRSVLALALATTWHAVSVSGEIYALRCAGTAQFKFTGSDAATLLCDKIPSENIADDQNPDAVVISLEDSVATITVREGTTTTDMQFIASIDTVKVDVRNTDFSKAASLHNLMFDNLKFVDQGVTLTIPDSLTYLRIGESNAEDVCLNASDSSNLNNLQLADTYNRIPCVFYERNYTSQLDTSAIKQSITFDWTGTQVLTEKQTSTLKHNIANLVDIGLTLVDDCSGSSNTSTHLVCASDSSSSSSSGHSDTLSRIIDPSSASTASSTGGSSSSSSKAEEPSGGGSSISTFLIAVSVAVILALGLFFLFIQHRIRGKLSGEENIQTPVDSDETPPDGHDKPIGQVQDVPDQPAHPRPWDDDVVIKARIPSDKVKLYDIMSRGAFGEVYRGSYRGQPVAVKMLNLSMRHETDHIELFFHEIKIMATLEHPNIVQFVGVAWDSLTEVCAVSELMDGGDLRTLLMEYHENRKPQGFDSVKIKIAADVAHALTYLHSFQPVVLHRDLESRNILLSADRKTAKVTDFGTSRERADITMTVGIGTSLWMAPEMIMGGRYDDKADIFSFGVVLSELATHELPYTQATKATSGAPMSVAAIMQAVVSGHLHLDFATSAPHSSPEIVDLACACTSFDPSTRPAAATVAWKLIQILRNMTD